MDVNVPTPILTRGKRVAIAEVELHFEIQGDRVIAHT